MYKDTLEAFSTCIDKFVMKLNVRVEFRRLNNRTLEEDQTHQDHEDSDDVDAEDQETNQTQDLIDYQSYAPVTTTAYITRARLRLGLSNLYLKRGRPERARGSKEDSWYGDCHGSESQDSEEMTTSSANNLVFRGFFEKQKLTGPNFIDWYRQLRIVLSIEDKLNYLEKPIPPAPEEGQSVSSYVLKIKGYIDNLERLGHPVTLSLGYLAELLKKKKNAASGAGGSGIFVIELNTILNRSWIYDIGYGTHICNTTQGLRASRKLKSVALSFNKRAKLDLDSALLWHCLLGHISKKRIKKLQHDGLLDSTDLRDFEKCVSCMSGNMARKPYTHQVERAKDLLGLIHIDDHGIIAHRTPPYTSQHNGVSERRNRTLLDMVKSMMSQITLPKFFWDYALKNAACILNMVPTKKVEKKPYEVWHGKAPKFSYLKVSGYPKESMGYSFYYPPENKVLVARNAEFLKNSLITQESSRSLEDLEIIQEENTHPSIDTSLNHEEDDLEINEPQSDIVPIRRPTRTRHALDCYTQTPGIDYKETFSPVADIRAIRILIAIVAYYDYEIWQMDVKTAFLNRYLNEKVYMEQLEGFVNPKYPNQRYCMENSKRRSIPMQEKLKLSKSQGALTPAELKRMQNVPYALAVDSIMYVVRCTRPDVAFAHNTGYVFILNGGAVDWKSAKQSIFATSYAEAEYIAAFDASKEAV
uniref:Integrase catalytic domain-containing protein n=1 Tax=Tanacetum cinerariifolium TaxID=118510 RepID=A0A6L2JFJ9_TANCI|nr:hypothetical protein [Tanacetum cinerariifolium]